MGYSYLQRGNVFTRVCASVFICLQDYAESTNPISLVEQWTVGPERRPFSLAADPVKEADP